MATEPYRTVLQYLRHLARPGPDGDRTDRQLLERFATQRDEAAFAALVQRHGPMVLGLCRRVLRHPHDAEDAFQATFLVLVRKAGAIARPELLGNWLYGVANRTAARARAELARRRHEDRRVLERRTTDPVEEAAWRELRPLLDEEVNRLPDRYRRPFVLCYLEGKTNAEAAELLGCPLGTVLSRLARARERLRRRLTRRGVGLSAGLIAGELSLAELTAAVPATLAEATVKAALRWAAGRAAAAGMVSARVLTWTEGGLRAMFLVKLRIAATAALAIGLAGAGAGLLTRQPRGEQPPAPAPTAAPARKAPQPPEETVEIARLSAEQLTALLAASKMGDQQKVLWKARHDAVAMETQARFREFLVGRGIDNFLIDSAQRFLKVQLELCTQKADRIAVRENHYQLLKQVYEVIEGRWKDGRIAIQSLKFCEFHRLEAEFELEKEKAGTKRP
jgi:RNA polymerase sigma factor (sigma-70 family)